MARKRLSLRDVNEIIAEFGRLPSPEGDRDAFALRAQVAEELSTRHQEIALERHEYTQRIRQMQREYDAIEAVADRAFGRGWGRRLASRPSASRVASRHASGRAEVYITDMGGSLVTAGPDGKRENIGRYGVWDGRGRRKPEVVATGDDLRKLQREYGPGLPVIRL